MRSILALFLTLSVLTEVDRNFSCITIETYTYGSDQHKNTDFSEPSHSLQAFHVSLAIQTEKSVGSFPVI